MLEECSPESMKAEQEEALGEWEKEKQPATETLVDSVSSFMKSLW